MTRNALTPIGNYFNNTMKAFDDMFNDCWHWPKLYRTDLDTNLKWEGVVGHANAYKKDGEYVLEVNVPGVKQEAVALTWKNRVLHLTVNSERTNEEKNRNYEYREYSWQTWGRTFKLPADIAEGTEPEAELKDGILTVRCKLTEPLPPPPAEEPKKIAVKKLD